MSKQCYIILRFKFDNFSSRAPESTVHGRILAALPFLQILLQFVHSCFAEIAPKKEKNLSEFASRPRDIEKSLSSPDSPQIFIHKVHFQSHAGGDRPGGVCCIFLEGGRPNAAVKPRYFLPYPSYVCRQETKPPNVFSKKTKTLFIFKLDRKRTQHIVKYLLALQGALHTCSQDLYFCYFCELFQTSNLCVILQQVSGNLPAARRREWRRNCQQRRGHLRQHQAQVVCLQVNSTQVRWCSEGSRDVDSTLCC